MIFASKLNRRITLQKPTTTRDPATNETQDDWETVAEKLAAGKIEKASSGKEDLEMGSAVRAEVTQEWEIRFIGINRIPKANWRIIDEYGFIHNLISPATEIGMRKGWLLKTQLVE